MMAGYKALLDKSIASAISAIEIYNKPDFKYREETFAILMVNAWELLLKAKIVKDNKNNLRLIHNKEKRKNKKGVILKKLYTEKNHSGNPVTINIIKAMTQLKLQDTLKENINLLVEIRNNAIHFLNVDPLLQQKVLAIGTATLQNYVKIINNWFRRGFQEYNFYLMPISFFPPGKIKNSLYNKKSGSIKNLLDHISKVQKQYSEDEQKDYRISSEIELKLVKVSGEEDIKFRYDSEAEQSIKVDKEQNFGDRYQFRYRELVKRMGELYEDFRQDSKFHKLKRKLEGNERYCYIRYLDPDKKSGGHKKYYSPEIFEEFDKVYTRKK